MGVERLAALLAESGATPPAPVPYLYVVIQDERFTQQGLLLAEALRNDLPGVRVQVNCGGGSFKSQLKRADKSGARYAILLGEDEVARGEVTIKHLREDRPQQTISRSSLATYLENLIEE